MTSYNKNSLGALAVNSEAVTQSVERSATSLEVHHLLNDGFALFRDGSGLFGEGRAVFAELFLFAGHGHDSELVDFFPTTLAKRHAACIPLAVRDCQ